MAPSPTGHEPGIRPNPDGGSTVTMVVTLNGTDANPWHRMGVRRNPFPQVGKAELNAAEAIIRSLDAEPIRDEADLRERLAGCSPELIEGCVKRYRPGQRTSFTISFPVPWS